MRHDSESFDNLPTHVQQAILHIFYNPFIERLIAIEVFLSKSQIGEILGEVILLSMA